MQGSTSMELNIGNSQFTYIDECKPSFFGAIYKGVAMDTTDGYITYRALDCSGVEVVQYFIVQEHSGITVQLLQCVGQSGAGDISLPTCGVVIAR